MRKVSIYCICTIILLGCNSESDVVDGGEGGSDSNEVLDVALKPPTYVLNSESLKFIDSLATELALSSAIEHVGLGYSGSSDSDGVVSEETLGTVGSTGSGSCDSGTYTDDVSGTGLNEDGSLKSSGEAIIIRSTSNCRYDYSKEEYDLEEGDTTTRLSWSGYESSTVHFDFLSVSVTFNEYSNKEYDASGIIYSSMFDGTLKAGIENSESSLDVAMSASFSQIDRKIVTIETKLTVKKRLSDSYPHQGVIEVNGGGGTLVVYTVVANGVEVRLNGGQVDLIEWEEM